MTDHPTQAWRGLSPSGEARRAAMRGMLLQEVDRRRFRRRLVRLGGATVGAVGVLAFAGWLAISSHRAAPAGPAGPLLAESPRPMPVPPITATHVTFQTVTTRVQPDDPRIVRVFPEQVRTIDDDELLTLLAAAGHTTGLIRAPDSVVLTAAIPPLPPSNDPG